MMTYPTSSLDQRATAVGSRISTVTFGPCWCRSVPGSDGSFDVFRHRSVESPLGRDVLVVSNRIPPSGVATLRRLHATLNDPLVIVAGACLSAEWYWDNSPSTWVDASEYLEVDHRVEGCLTGQPEIVFGVLLRLALAGSADQPLTTLTEVI